MREEDKRKAAMVYRIYCAAKDLGMDELRIVELVTARLDFGQRKYGKFVLDSSPKDWIKEYSEEALDAVVYSTCAAMKASNAAESAVAGRLLSIALCGVQESTYDVARKSPVKPSLSDRIYFAISGREVPIMVAIFIVLLVAYTGWHLVSG